MRFHRRRGLALSTAVVGTTCMLLAGCSGSADDSAEEKPTVGWIVPLPDPWTQPMTKAMELKADQLGITVKTLQANYDVNLQLQSMDTLIQQGADAILSIPLDVKALQPGVDRANDRGIPFLQVLGYEPENQRDISFNVVSNDEENAEEIAKLAAAAAAKTGECKAGIMSGNTGVTILNLRAQGLRAGLEAAGCEILDEQFNQDGTIQRATEIARSWEARFGSEMTVIVGIDDTNAEGSVAAKRGDFQPIITGFNGEDSVRPLIESGDILATVQQPYVQMGAVLLDAADKLIRGEDVPAAPLLEAPILTADNLDEIPSEEELASRPLEVEYVQKGDQWLVEVSLS